LVELAREEGLINDNDDMTLDENDLKILEEKRGLKIKAGGYTDDAKSLKDMGITEINLSNADTKLEKNFDNQGNDLMTQAGATFKVNGEEREYADIWHKKLDENEIKKEEPEFIKPDYDYLDESNIFKYNKKANFFDAQNSVDKAIENAQKILKKYT